MDRDTAIIVIAALLHDIGKFAQRAGRPYTQEMVDEVLPQFKGARSHWHAVYTDYFIEKDLPLPKDLESSRSHLARLAAAHHRPNENSLEEMVLMISDRLSAGMDRSPAEEGFDESAGFKEARLVSIFDEVELGRHVFDPSASSHYRLAPLLPGAEAIFPAADSSKGDPEEYEVLFSSFMEELKGLNVIEANHFYIEALLSLLEKYTWCIPSSSYRTIADISLLDHAISTAGIAQALYLYHRANGGVPDEKDRDEKWLLIGGDLSGIQRYIFDISRGSGKGVSKIYRARSFYLQVLTRGVLLDLQRRLGLFGVCRMLDTGGKFVAIVPNTESVRTELSSFEEMLQLHFRRHFKGLMTLNISWSTTMIPSDFKMENFRKNIDQVMDSIERSKCRKLSRTFAAHGPILDEDYSEFENGNCAVCGVQAADPEAEKTYYHVAEAGIPICKDCCEQIYHIGSKLPKTNFLVYGKNGRIPLFGDICVTLTERPPTLESPVAIHVDALIDEPRFARYRLARFLPVVTSEELSDPKWFELLTQETDLIAGSGDPTIKTFGMIAKKSKKVLDDRLVGRELIGLLKADIDNLGLVFSFGLERRLSVARFTMLSRMLHLFFSEYLVDLVNRKYPDIYIVFSGGDDMLLVGPWWQALLLAAELRKEFTRFCCRNPDISMSAGLHIARPRTPMRRAVEKVEELLAASKALTGADRSKDAVSLLGETMAWDELEHILEMAKKLDKAMEEKSRTRFSSAFMHRLLEYHRMYRRFIRGENMKDGRYLSLAHYDIGRNVRPGLPGNTEEFEMLHRIFSVGVDARPELRRLNVPIFYAINMNRE